MIVSLQISIFCHKKKRDCKKNTLLVSLKLDTCTARCKIKTNMRSSLDGRERNLRQLELQRRAGGRARDAARALLLGTGNVGAPARPLCPAASCVSARPYRAPRRSPAVPLLVGTCRSRGCAARACPSSPSE